jgi:glycosyltransferase involved in cell wall biosynthesis
VRVVLLLPTLNEAQGLPRTLARLPRERLRAQGHRLEVLIVDGASTDGTPDVAERLGARVIDEPRKGYGRAYKTGFAAAADAHLVVTADADDTYPLDLLPDLLERFASGGYDFATIDRLASLERRAMGATNRFGNWVLTTTARLLYGVTLRDSQSGMWILSRRALERLPIEALSDGMAFSQQIKLHAMRDRELRSIELPGRYYVRIGEVKLARWRDGLRNLWQLVRGRFSMARRGQASR